MILLFFIIDNYTNSLMLFVFGANSLYYTNFFIQFSIALINYCSHYLLLLLLVSYATCLFLVLVCCQSSVYYICHLIVIFI